MPGYKQCQYKMPSGLPCGSPARKARGNVALCGRHADATRRQANIIRARAEKLLLAQRRVHRAANSARARYAARIQRERDAIAILRLDSPDAVLHVRDTINHATRLGIFPPRDAECMQQLLFLAAKNLKEIPTADVLRKSTHP